MTVKQVILVRTAYPDGKGGTFKPRLGKLAAQVAHASMKVFFDAQAAVGTVYEERLNGGLSELDLSDSLIVHLTPDMREWVFGTFTKIVLGVEDEADLLKARDLAEKARLPHALIQDIGKTEFNGVPTYTALAIGPALSDEIDCITGPSGSVRTRLI